MHLAYSDNMTSYMSYKKGKFYKSLHMYIIAYVYYH